jgi:hypothetical protein
MNWRVKLHNIKYSNIRIVYISLTVVKIDENDFGVKNG